MTEQKMCCGTTCDKQEVADYIEKLEQARDELAAQNAQLKFRLVDSVKLAAVVAFPETHQDACWQKMAKSHMNSVRTLFSAARQEAEHYESNQESSN